jgi:acyl carrier protein
MQFENLENDIREIIAEIIEKNPADITPEAKFVDDLGVDSMMALEIMAAIEKKYKIAIPEEKLPQLATLKDTVAIAKEYLAAKGA